jgi:hypothetical protein
MSRALLVLSLAVFLLLTSGGVSRGNDWQVMRFGDRPRGIWAGSPTDLFVVGEYGSIQRYDGATWTTMLPGVPDNSVYQGLYSVWGASSGDVYAVGEQGRILRYQSQDWTPMTSGTGSTLYAIWGGSPSSIFTVGADGAILHFDGSQWTQMASGTTNHLGAVWGSSPNDVFAAGAGGTILHYDGSHWATMSSGTTETFTAIWGSSSNNVFAVGTSGCICHYDGTTWTIMESGTTENLSGIWGSSANDVLAVGWDGQILRCTGSTWTPQATDLGNLTGIGGVSSSDIFVLSYSGAILRSAGPGWAPMASSTPTLKGIWGSAASDVFVGGDNGVILRYHQSAWLPSVSLDCAFTGIWGSPPGDVLAVGRNGSIFRDAGLGWVPIDGETYDLNAIWGSSQDDAFAVGLNGTILHYDRTAVAPMNSGTTSHLFGVWGASANDVFAVGGGGTIVHYDGASWAAMASGTSFSLLGIWGSSPDDVFAVGECATILHYDGSAWSTVTSDPQSSWHLEGIWGSSANDVFVVGWEGTILHYDGADWSWMDSGTQDPLKGVWGSSPTDVFVVGGLGLVLHYAGSSPASIVQLGPAVSGGPESATPAAIEVTLSEAWDQPVTVSYTTENGTAMAGVDYEASTGTLTFAPGVTTLTISVPIIDDSAPELNETFTVTLFAPTGGAILGSQSSVTVTILDDDPLPRVQFARSASSGPESATAATIDVSLSAPSIRPVTVQFATVNGTATAPADYAATSGILTFDTGVTNRTITLPIIDDAVKESNETFKVVLSKPAGATLGGRTTHTFTITNDDPHGLIQLSSAAYFAGEAGPKVTITVTRIGGGRGAVGVSYATSNGTAKAGRDYAARTGKLAWPDGDVAEKTFEVPITSDALDEPDETFFVKLSTPTGGAALGSPRSGTVTIADSDPAPAVGFSQVASSGAEAQTARLGVSLSAPSGKTITVEYAVLNGTALVGADYSAKTTTVKFAWDPSPDAELAGYRLYHGTTTEGLFALQETVGKVTTAKVTGVPNGPHCWRLTACDFGGHESGFSNTICLQAAMVGTLTFSPGQMSKTISVPIVNDAALEPTESFTVTLANPVNATLGATKTHTYTIVDDDAGVIQLSAAAYSVWEAGQRVTITAKRTGGSRGAVSASFTILDGTATAGSDYTLPAIPWTLTWGDGDKGNKTIAVPIPDDPFDEPKETFTVTLSAPTGGALLGSPSAAIVTIIDNDPAPAGL